MSDHKPIAPECLMRQAEELSRRQSNEQSSLAATAESCDKKRYRITPDDDASRAVEVERPLVVMVMAERFVACAKKVTIEEIPPNVGISTGANSK